MNLLSRIAFPVAVVAVTATGAMDLGRGPVEGLRLPEPVIMQDTVVYPVAGYKLRRTLSLEEITVLDTTGVEELADTLALAIDTLPPRLSPRDSLKALLDSTMWDKLDSIYLADSTAKAKAAFDAWYSE